jgi:hypothetical protein
MPHCVFCGRSANFGSPGDAKSWICSSCMRDLAEELHREDRLGVKKLEYDIRDIKREIGDIKRKLGM